jgi:hypothetical protein
MSSAEMVAVGSSDYPRWKYYPARSQPPRWVDEVVGTFAAARDAIDSEAVRGVTSDRALAEVRPGLMAIGFEIEGGRSRADRIRRAVLFAEMGRPLVAYEVDGFHPEHRIVLEIEAGRGAANNADYRDLVRTSLMVDADFLVLAMMLEYRAGRSRTRSCEQTRDRIDAIYASERLKLPLVGLLLLGY